MPCDKSRLLPRLSALAALLLAQAGLAADWTYLDTPSDAVDLHATIALQTAHGFALLGQADVYNATARYDAAGQLQSARYIGEPNAASSYSAPISAVRMPDDGFVALLAASGPISNPICLPVRFRADGSLLWTAIPTAPDCHTLGADDSGGFWLSGGGNLSRYAADGTRVFDVDVTTVAERHYVGTVDPASGTAYAAVNKGAPDFFAIAAHTVAGARHELWNASNAQTSIDFVSLAADGNLYATGNSNGALYAISLTPSGDLRWEKAIPNLGAKLQASATLPDGKIVMLDRNSMLYALASDGSLRWSTRLVADACDPAACPGIAGNDRIAVAPDGSIAVLLSSVPELLRLDANGTTFARTRFGRAVRDDAGLLFLADGSVLVGPLAATNSPSDTLFARVAADGSQPGDPAVQGVLKAELYAAYAGQDASGALYVVASRANTVGGTAWLSKISADGHLAWRQALDGTPYTFDASPHLRVGNDRVCLVMYDSASNDDNVQCRAASDGTPLWSRHSLRVLGFGLLGDASVILVSGDSVGRSHLTSVTSSGAVERDQELPYVFNYSGDKVAIGTDGSAYVASLFNNGGVFAWNRSGTLRYAASTGSNGELDEAITPADDGSVVVLSDGGTGRNLRRLAPDGQTVWTQSLGASALLTAIVGDQVLTTEFIHAPDSSVLRKFALADGSPQASVALPALPPQFILPDYDANAGVLIYRAFGASNVGQFTLVDPADGKRLRTLVQDCDGEPCVYYQQIAMFDGNGTLRTILQQQDGSGARFRVDATEHAATPQPQVRIDQPGIAGAWYAPYEAGQGFSLDYIGSANSIFMPWFTYGIDDVLSPAELAWYTLQGSVTPGATQAELQIARAAPGRFDNGNVGVSKVGTAVLQFSDCNSGLLFYQFDGSSLPGPGGAIALSRLTPSTSPCVLANGSSAPAQIAAPAAQGFDARQSGSWFEPATAGQGVQITVIPRTASFSGLVFAAWFTFDPAGSADDDAQEHWFTLQGDLGSATAGSVDLPILRTLGGALDSSPTGDTWQVGHATLTFLACDRARLDYVFDSGELAHAYAHLSGSLDLQKIGGCAP